MALKCCEDSEEVLKIKMLFTVYDLGDSRIYVSLVLVTGHYLS